MKQGDKCVYDGYEVCLFPLDRLYCTQTWGSSSFSHCCGKPTDWIGSSSHYPYYAPFSCTRYYRYNSTVCYVSDDKVWTPKGLTYVSILFTHDESIPTQTHFNQGDIIGHTGIADGGTGDHMHLEGSNVANDRWVGYGVICGGYGNECWALQNPVAPNDLFYLTGEETIINTQGLSYETWQDSPIGEHKFKWWMFRLLLERRKRYGI